MTCETEQNGQKSKPGRPRGTVNKPAAMRDRETPFGKYITRHRLVVGKTQRQCAAEAGVALTTWSNYETGDITPDVTTCHRIAPVLGLGWYEVAAKARPAEAKLLRGLGEQGGNSK